ncbi:MAG: EAL domain-containing protein [Candidatus Obscuribacterales bacterium]|nr:EAL domain-containing protein [Candidatus Obscuribacterales bacterium]
MNARVNLKTVLASVAAFIIVGFACISWVPTMFFPLGKSLEKWLDQRSLYFHELQLAQEALRDVEFSHHAYFVTGEPRALNSFNDASKSVKHHISLLNSMRQGDLMLGEKARSLSERVLPLLDELQQSAETRKNSGKPRPDELDKSGENREIREISREVARLQEEEFDAVRDKAAEYNRMIGPYPWIVVVTMVGCIGAVMLLAMQGRSQEPGEVDKIARLTSELDTTKEQLERLSKMDMLTEVLNLRGLEKAIIIEENKITRAGGHMIALLINCDNFKRINESLGMATGDVVLKDVARRIMATLRPSDHVARVDGGDEFLVLLPDTQLAYGLRVAERIRVAVSDNPLHSLQEVVQVTVSLGVATLPHKVSSVAHVISICRGALRRSKQTGKNKVSLARDGGGESEMPASTEEVIQSLLDDRNFRTVYQPIIDLATEEVAGFEIFSRGPEGAFENPGDLFRVCVENNILTSVDLQCLKLCLDMSHDVAENMRVHVNLFPSTILDTPIENLLQVFPENKGGRTYCVEISEQQFVGDPSFMREHVQKLRAAGILVAIDDIGFGRSSLETLIFLEPDVIKVDRTYVTGVAEDKYKRRLLKRLTNVAKSLGAEVVAEGVERREDLPVLQELGVHFAQGFLWGALLEVLPSSPAEQRNIPR